MEYKRLGKTGLKVSQLCLGMMSYGDPKWRDWVLPEDQAEPFVKMALDAGINFFDTAYCYGYDGESERLIGRVLGHRRDEIAAVLANVVILAVEPAALLGIDHARVLMGRLQGSCGPSGTLPPKSISCEQSASPQGEAAQST